MKIVIKNKYLKTKVAFGARALPLEQRTEKELEQLALMARESNSPQLIEYFESLPTLDELQKSKTDQAIAAIPPAATTATKPNTSTDKN
ncbi:MAG: hypothetical protein WC756_17675 [Taibaiella sp.]|jgi:hypothetical protein